MRGIFRARIIFAQALHEADHVAPVSVDDNGWVTEWDDKNPEQMVAMFPPQSILGLILEAGKKP